jgi:hypothetical protein
VLIRKRSGGPASDRFGRLADPPWYALLSFAAERKTPAACRSAAGGFTVRCN